MPDNNTNSQQAAQPTSTSLPQLNPLTEAKSDSLDFLFSLDPLKYQEQDRKAIVAAMRQERERWAEAEATGKKFRSGAKQTKAPKPDLNINDLF